MALDTKILVIEDDPILKNLLNHVLINQYNMLYASNGAEGITMMEDNQPSLILLDLMMPDMDGFTFLEKTRGRDDGLKDVPIIIASNLGEQEDIDRAMSLGANGYLVKANVSVDEIIKKIKETLGE